jgi:hypothetical protein
MLSRETALKILADTYGIDDIAGELARIRADPQPTPAVTESVQ